MKDLFGKALLDYQRGNYTEDLKNETNISEEDELPLPYLFRAYEEMPPLEQKALQLAKGTVLDVGCGAGSHALYLQNQGLEVMAIDISPGAVEVSRLRGLKNVRLLPLRQMKAAKFDTILLLMNGSGIFGKLDDVSENLIHLKSLLSPNGQILVDSSDLKYMFDEGDDGAIWVPGDRYYGELEYILKYKGAESEPFDWLYMGEGLFDNACRACDLSFEVILRGPNFDYLARITSNS